VLGGRLRLQLGLMICFVHGRPPTAEVVVIPFPDVE
jgi:hypothetical protein